MYYRVIKKINKKRIWAACHIHTTGRMLINHIMIYNLYHHNIIYRLQRRQRRRRVPGRNDYKKDPISRVYTKTGKSLYPRDTVGEYNNNNYSSRRLTDGTFRKTVWIFCSFSYYYHYYDYSVYVYFILFYILSHRFNDFIIFYRACAFFQSHTSCYTCCLAVNVGKKYSSNV